MLPQGRLWNTRYDFEKKGDVLPLHSHKDGGAHSTQVVFGSFRIFGPWGENIAKAGDFIPWTADQDHGFEALEPNSRLLNIPYA